MEIHKKIDTIRNLSFLAIPFSIVVTYIGVFSFYLHFGLDITPYLSFEDLTIIYFRYTCASFIYLGFLFIFIYQSLNSNEESYWEKTIGKTIFRRRVIPSLLFLIILIILMVTYETARTIISITFVSFFVVGLIYGALIDYNLNNDNEKKYKNEIIAAIPFFLIMILIIPFSIGGFLKENFVAESVIIYLDNNTIDAQEKSNVIFIGSNSKYLFLKNKTEKTVEVIPIDKLNSIKYCDK